MVFPGLYRTFAVFCLSPPFLFRFSTSFAQSISTSTPIPPLQWINLTGLLSGSNPAPPLKDASIGYDDTSRDIIIFGGESAQGFPQSQTYLLNLDSLEWRSAASSGLGDPPPARSAAISGDDFAASYRHAHVVIGGKGDDGKPLSDVWEFDYNNQFWAQVGLSPGGPSARWGAAGGIDIRTPFLSSSAAAAPNNTIYLAGGFDGINAVSLGDLWALSLSGTLSSNNINDVNGSWTQISVNGGNNLPSRTGAAGAVVSQGAHQQIVAVNGCSDNDDSSCAQQQTYVLNADTNSEKTLNSCPAPRVGPTLTANFNSVSSSFASQVFLLLGIVDASKWDDGGALQRGEVAVLDISGGSWARVLPAGDPDGSGKPTFPSPREGAVAVSASKALVGKASNVAADTIVFGGRDASGQYLSEVWLLRTYNVALTQTNQTWSGYGNGQLSGGVNADGVGVTIQYLTECASAVSQPTKTGTGSTSSTASSPAKSTNSASPAPTSSTNSSVAAHPYDTTVVHKLLAPISVALALPAVTLFRFSSPSVSPAHTGRIGMYYLSVLVGVAAFGVGIGGLVASFTSIHSTAALVKRASSSLNLKTAHGQAGIALFAAFYGLMPILFLVSARFFGSEPEDGERRRRADSNAIAEKMGLCSGRPSPTSDTLHDSVTVHRRGSSRSWGLGWAASRGHRRPSSESNLESSVATPTKGSFEVTNRPQRIRRASGNSLAAFSDPRPSGTPRNLADMSWFERRRSVSTAGDMDIAAHQMSQRQPDPSTPGTVPDMTSTNELLAAPRPTTYSPEIPPTWECLLHILFHALLLALCILSLVALWTRAPKAAFGVFLAWTVVFYAIVVILAWYGVPRRSLLTVFIRRLRGTPPPTMVTTPSPSRPLSDTGSVGIPFPSTQRGPYQNHPPFRATLSPDHDYPASHGHETAEAEDDEEDEDTRQHRIEEEMSRRDVSIVTVPKRKLFLTNPEERIS